MRVLSKFQWGCKSLAGHLSRHRSHWLSSRNHLATSVPLLGAFPGLTGGRTADPRQHPLSVGLEEAWAAAEWFRSLCPQLPGVMEKPVWAPEYYFGSSCLWSLPAGRAQHCCVLHGALKTEPVTRALRFLLGACIWACAISRPALRADQRLRACAPSRIHMETHFVRGMRRQQ